MAHQNNITVKEVADFTHFAPKGVDGQQGNVLRYCKDHQDTVAFIAPWVGCQTLQDHHQCSQNRERFPVVLSSFAALFQDIHIEMSELPPPHLSIA